MNIVDELLVNILQTSLSGGIVIALILLIRIVFRSSPKALICLCWVVAIVRLLLPIHIEANWSLQPSATMLTNQVESFRITSVSGTVVNEDGDEITLRQPSIEVDDNPDWMRIFSVVWLSGAALMLGSAMASYMRLRHRVGEAVKVADNVYCCTGLDTAFLFGYFFPRIYLPEINDQNTRFVYMHEKAHLRRGDHWLMLFGYAAVCLHWFNPLVWLFYVCLCRDIEGACDERVISTLGVEERKAYANALLACGRHRSFPVSCPVAFGEVSIKRRIIGVLNYRKPTVWICSSLVVMLIVIGFFFLTDPVAHPPYYMELMNNLDKPLVTVCDNLGIKKDDLVAEEAGDYATPIYVEYAGVTMQLNLHTDISDKDESLRYFSYAAVFEDGTGEAEQAAAAIAHKLYRTYGPGERAKLSARPDLYKDISADEIAAALKDAYSAGSIGQIFDHWDISDSGHGNLDAYLANLQTEYYQKNEGGTAKVCYLVRFLASCDYTQNRKTISVVFRNYLNFTVWEDGDTVTYTAKLNLSK